LKSAGVLCHMFQEPLRLGTESKPVRDVTTSDSNRKMSTDSTNVSRILLVDLYELVNF